MATIRKILVERGMVQNLARLFETTPQTVRNALRYHTEGELPDRIRAEAIKQGGAEIKRKMVSTSVQGVGVSK